MIQRLAAERATTITVGFQGCRGLTAPSDLSAQLVDHAIRRAASTA